MPFTFLNPWFWLGAVALGVPIWLHLRRRREKRLVRFAAVRFLEDQPMAARQPMRLRDLLLFFCRAAAVLLIIAAFAWPYLRRASNGILRESVVYILDNTLSHQAGNGFQKSRDRLLQDLKKLGGDVQVAVIELTARPQVVAAFSDSRAVAIDRVAVLTPTFERGSYLAAFRQAADLLANSLGQEKRIVLLGDNQENQWTENVSSLPFLRDVKVDLPAPAEAQLPNLSLSDAHAERVFVGEKSWIHFTVKLTRAGTAANAVVRVQANDQVVAEQELDLTDPTMLLQVQWEADPGQWLRGVAEVKGEPDALSQDNQVCFAVPPLEEGKVLLLGRSPFLQLALSPEIMRGHWATREVSVPGLAEEAKAGPSADVLCVESGFLQSTDARQLVTRQLEAGRGVVLFLDRVTPAIDTFLQSLDFQVEGNLQREVPEKFQFIASSHRIFRPFSSPDYGNLLEVGVRNYFKVRAQRATPLILSEEGNGLLFEAARQQGKLFVIPFGLDREHSSWPIHPTYIPFLDLLLQAAGSGEEAPESFEPGETVPVRVPAGVSAREVVLRSEGRVWDRAEVRDGAAQVSLPPRPGLYDLVFAGTTQAERVVAVNPSSKESDLVYVTGPQALNGWRLDPTKSELERNRRVEASLVAVLQQRYWWWMLLAGLLALAAEMALLARARRA